MGSRDTDHAEFKVKEAVPAEADAQVEANTGKNIEESAAAPAEEKVQCWNSTRDASPACLLGGKC